MQYLFPQLAEQGVDLYLKLENMQNTGSFELRGVVNQIAKIKSRMSNQNHRTKFVTNSAVNFGKAFGYVLQQRSLLGVCIMPDSSSQSKMERIKCHGVKVELCPATEIQSRVDRYVAENEYHYCDSNDDRDLMAGYSSIGLEILEALPEFDILLICCEGGGLPAGVSAAIRSKLKRTCCQIYAIESESSPTMFEKILNATKKLFDVGLIVEPSGSAAMAALLSNKIPDVKFKKVVVIVSGGNITPDELKELI
ncbi:hypothetical protein LOTGIDRAFT_130508 [Lottia gigantea]|uniref:L-serine deaminase n=1 Tax=Lottia gigantea TaxID=225164 RepID=V3ZWI0_LOTGI|nr:hypothetical protein LOTGIDRAFT_130508 [Lottia gigantea]ESO85316.1 hypothetical protein LOTGIDRAFT_130508 [Lottia gigantea]